MVRRRLRQHQTEELAQRKRIGRSPGDGALRVQAFEVANQQQPKVAPGRQPRPAVVGVDRLTEPFDVPVEIMRVEDLIQSRVKRMCGAPRRSLVATHIDVCFARRRRLPIAIGDSVVRGIDRVDP